MSPNDVACENTVENYLNKGNGSGYRPYRPDYKSGQFWATLAGMIVSTLVFFQFLGPGDHSTLTDFIAHSMEGLLILLPQTAVLYRYLKARSDEHQSNLESMKIEQRRVEQELELAKKKAETAKVEEDIAKEREERLNKIVNEKVQEALELLKAKPPVPADETEEERINRLVEERLQEVVKNLPTKNAPNTKSKVRPKTRKTKK